MALIPDIPATYRSPRAVFRRQLALGPREDRALLYLLLACGLIFVAQWPRLAARGISGRRRCRSMRGSAGALLAWVFIAPLALYGLAALSHLAARGLRGQGTGYTARLALFWALLAAAPLWLLNGA